MNYVKFFFSLITVILLLGRFSFGQNIEIVELTPEQQNSIILQKQLEEKYEVNRGLRPPINLENIPDSAYVKGIIRVKVKPYLRDYIFRNYCIQEGSVFLTTGNTTFDKINEQIGAYKYTNLLYTYYDKCEKEYVDEFKERHQAWGFNLIVNIEFDTRYSVIDAINKFEALDMVEYAEPVYKIKSNSIKESMTQWVPNDTYQSQQYALTNIQAFDAWNIVNGNPNIIVAIVDQGIAFQHPDIWANMWPTVGPDENNTMPAPHGTQVGGVVGAVSNNNLGVAGIAGGDGSPSSGIKLMSIDIYNPDGNTYWGNGGTFLGQVFAADNDAAITNNSWGWQTPNVYQQEDLDGIDYFNEYGGGDVMEGGLVVFCAQNCGEDGAYYPAYYGSDDPSTIGAMAVAATDCNDVKWLWSNFGTWVDISAPGVSVLTTNNDNGYISVTGTSLAAPYVSGVAALILSHAYNQGATLINTDVWDILVNNTDNIEDVNYPCFVGKLGSGRLNAFNSLNDYDNCYYYNPVNLIISCNTIWANNVDNKRTIEIHNGANLTISGFTLMQSNTSIIVKNSSILTIDGGHLTKRCDKLWQGIIVENGGTLRIINGGQIKEFEHIIIEDGGTIEYYANSQIELSDDESHLNIVGNLVISNNAQFTFTGNGYIIFSNPGPDATYNITAGTGASMLFSGSGQSDKVLEIQQNTVHFPQLSSLTFHNCKIEMGTSKRMQADVSYPVTFNNVKVTSTTGSNNSHRSFLFIGQSNVTINNCMFEYGQYGIYGNLTWTDGTPLYINNSIFRNNTKGMHIIGKGIHLINCTVLDNSTYGIYCTGMSFPSAFESCYFISNNDGLYYNGSTSSNIDIEDTYFAFNYNDGIRASGGFNLNLECSFVIDNVRYGIYATNGTKIYPFKCDMSNNLKTIYLNYGTVNLNAKYNQLQALNDGYTIYGFAPSKAACGINVNQICNNNRWELNQSAIPVYNSNFRLWVYGCPTNPPTIINLTDSNPLFQTCGSKMSRESLLAIDTVNQSMFFTRI